MIAAVLIGICMITYHRKIVLECKKHYINSFNLFNFWFRIDDLWRKSKRPGHEPLKKALIGYGLSYLGLMFAIVFTIVINK